MIDAISHASEACDHDSSSRPFSFEAVDRSQIDSVKWSTKPHELPMWVADMDFATAPAIVDAVQERASNPTYGYSLVSDEFGQTIAAWWQQEYQTQINPADVIFAAGVIPAISSAIRSLTNPGEKIVIQSPVYNNFYTSIINNGRQVCDAPLIYQAGEYSMDFAALEEAFSDPLTTMMILCNPQNPTGNIWSADDLAIIAQLAKDHHVIVVSDEIHCDIRRPGLAHVPFASVSSAAREVAVTCNSPSKAFNMAGLHSAYLVVSTDWIRRRVQAQLIRDGVAEPTVFSCPAAIAAYAHSRDWLRAVNHYIQENKDYARTKLSKNLPNLHIPRSDATYLLWLDCRAFTSDADLLSRQIRQQTGLYLSSGKMYGPSGAAFLRMNLGTSRTLVEDGTDRLIQALSRQQ